MQMLRRIFLLWVTSRIGLHALKEHYASFDRLVNTETEP